jgi:sterol desaturase/sphingolipid hydroxylase (fatty acid hydroxylase superfamily)
MIDVTKTEGFLLGTLILFIILVVRYFVFGAVLHWVFFAGKTSRWASRKVYSRDYEKKQFRSEVAWSMASSLIFAISGAVLGWQYLKGYTLIYLDWGLHGWWYLPVSLVLVMVLHEAYYYLLHRWMHIPSVYRIVHKVHHDSHVTSPWTAFSFHPLEAVIQSLFLPLVLMIVPMHAVVLLVLLMIMTVSGFINHLGYEVYPEGFDKHPLGKWLIGATHHARHHKQFRYNFGLYFTFLDRAFHTEAPSGK